MSDAQRTKPYLLTIIEDNCREIGATLYAEPEYGYAGYIQFQSGNRRFFRGTSLDINHQGASAIAKDKDYCAHFLRHEGFSVPESVLVFSPRYRAEMAMKNIDVAKKLTSIDKAIEFVEEFGFPVFVKPNEGSEGRGVGKIYSIDQLFDTLYALFQEYPRVLVQRPVLGNDYRVVVLDGEVLSAYERRPFRVHGDGRRPIRELIQHRIRDLQSQGRGKKVSIDDIRIVRHLQSQQLTLDSVPGHRETVDLLPNANLSMGGEAIDITDAISPALSDVCISVTRALGLAFAGVDILCNNATEESSDYTILEVNSAPGLNNFAFVGQKQDRAVRKLYKKLLYHLDKS